MNITSVQLTSDVGSREVAPSISQPHRLATVTIRENDNARGIVSFNMQRVGGLHYFPMSLT